jgi:hypothetical protein
MPARIDGSEEDEKSGRYKTVAAVARLSRGMESLFLPEPAEKLFLRRENGDETE